MSNLHYVTISRDESLFDAIDKWEATRPADALNVVCYRYDDEIVRVATPTYRRTHAKTDTRSRAASQRVRQLGNWRHAPHPAAIARAH